MLQLFDFALGTELFKRQWVLIPILDLRKSWMHDIYFSNEKQYRTQPHLYTWVPVTIEGNHA
jgi:hypothetical protein